MNIRVSRVIFVCGAICISAMTQHAFADFATAPGDSDQTTGLTEIIVTATRQAVSAQSVPISLTAIGAAELREQGIISANQLNQVVPSLYIQEGIGTGTPRFSIRGVSTTDIGPNGTSPVTLYVDDIANSNSFGNSMGLFDLQRVEVLRGPQGTLFGKNTTGGAIDYFSQIPTNDATGYITAHFAGGDQSMQFLEGAINLPIIDHVLAMRLSFHAEHEGDYVDDPQLNRNYGQGHYASGRVQLRWTPSDATTVNFTLFGTSRSGDAPIYHGQYLAPCDPVLGPYLCNGSVPKPAPGINAETVALTNIADSEHFSNEGAILRVEQDIDSSRLTSISSFKHVNYKTTQDNDGFPGDYFTTLGPESFKETTQEFRFSTDTHRRLSGVVGLYYEHDYLTVDGAYYGVQQVDPIYQFVTRLLQTNDTRTYAAFGNLTFKITDQVSFVGGARKSEDKRANYGTTDYMYSGNYNWNPNNTLFPIASPPATPTFIAPFDQHVTWTPWTWDATLSFKPTNDILVFARVADGFRSGGFNSASLYPSPALPYYNPETLRSYELGIKSNLLGNTVEINSTIYHYNYQNMQVTTTFGGVLLTQNAASSKVDGGELEIVARPTPPLELRSSFAYTNARFSQYQVGTVSYAGNSLPQAPKYTATASAAYTIPVSANWDLRPLTNWTYRSQVYYDQKQDSNIGSGTLVQGNVRLALLPHGKSFSISAFVNNVGNKKPVTYGYSFYPEFYDQTFGLGRIYGAEITYRW